jgi:N-acyl-D-aspartate/D-glutamate deacylase
MGAETPEGILLSSSPSADAQPYTGMRLSEAAKKLNKPPAEALLDLVALSRGNFAVVRFVMSEDDVKLALQKSWVSLDTDMWGQATDGPYEKELAHPRAFGSTPRLLGHYVRELNLLTLEDAVRKMTSLPARRLGFGDRGLVRPGMAADLVVFDPATVRETSTFEKPLSYAEGISHVVVNGKLVLDGGKLTAERPGRLLWHGH